MITPLAMRLRNILLIAFLTLGQLLEPAPRVASSAELSAVHLVYEKPRKMKRADTVLFMPFFDQTRKSDTPERARSVQCGVVATGRRGELPVRGRIELRLVGSIRANGASWESGAVVTDPVDGEAHFDPEEIAALVDEATAERAAIDLFRVDFDGGRGKKLVKLTLDCMQEEAAP